jgi:WD40 repeat protein
MLRSLSIGSKPGLPALAISPDGSTLVGAWYQNVRVWDFNSGKVLFQGVSSNGTPQFSKDGSRLAVYGSADRSSIVIYDTSNWTPITKLAIPTQTLQLALSPDGKTLVTGGENNKGIIHFWDAATGKELGQATDNLAPAGMVFSSDGKILVVGGPFKGSKSSIPLKMLSLWDTSTRQVIAQLSSPSIPPQIMTIDPAGGHIAYADLGGDVSIWGQADDQIMQARQVLMTYLDDLYQKKYTDAAGLYYSDRVEPNSPDSQFLKKSHPKLDLNNLVGVLQTTCEDKRFPCGKFRDVVYQGNVFVNSISFYVEFSALDGSASVSPIPCSGIPSTCEPVTSFLFNLTKGADGTYKLASLPPAAEFP